MDHASSSIPKVNCGEKEETQYYSAVVSSSGYPNGIRDFKFQLCMGVAVRYVTFTLLTKLIDPNGPCPMAINTFQCVRFQSQSPFTVGMNDYDQLGYINVSVYFQPPFLLHYAGRSPPELS